MEEERSTTQFNYVLNSTHVSNWVLSIQNLAKRKKIKDKKYKVIIHKCIKNQKPPLPKETKHFKFTAKDEENIIIGCLDRMFIIIDQCFSDSIKTVIMNYSACLMRRFYLNSNLLNCDAERMMKSCIILATKLGEVNVDIKELMNTLKNISSEKYIKTELNIVKVLKFNLHIEDSISALFFLYEDLCEKANLEMKQSILSELLETKKKYFKSRNLYFMVHPLLFNLLVIQGLIKKLGLSLQLSDLVDISAYAQKVIDNHPEWLSQLNKSVVESEKVSLSANKFKKLYLLMKTFLGEKNKRSYQRPKSHLRKRMPVK